MKKPLSGQQATVKISCTEESLPAPVGGLNFRDPLSAQGPADAIILDNLICNPREVTLRKGQADFVTGLTVVDKVWALMPYRAAPNDKLFGATDTGIYDVTTAGAIGAALVPCTNGKWECINGSNAGIHYLLAVNGTDNMKFYNGIVWADAVITGISSSAKFTNIAQFKFRVMFTEKDTLSFWYLDVNAVQGVAHEFPLAPLFTKGGSLLAIGNWTIDGGDGQDDFVAFVTTEGEVAVYRGIDPSSATDFALVGVYSLPRPIGRKCLIKYGGDLLVITESGIVLMSKMLISSVVDRNSSISDKIVGAVTSAAAAYKSNFGWSLTLFSAESILILNIPTVEGSAAVQLVMNTITGSWSMFRAMNALCFCEFGARLFYGTPSKVVNALVGTNDFGGIIQIRAKTSFQSFRSAIKSKRVKLLRPNIRVSKSLQVNLAISVNYQDNNYVSPAASTPNNQSLWDISVWDGAYWVDSDFIVDNWRSIAHKPGYVLSLLLLINDVDYTFSWNTTDYLIETGFAFG